MFIIAREPNAASRMMPAKRTTPILIAKPLEDALQWAEQLHSDNTDRKADTNITEALALIEAGGLIARRSTIIISTMAQR